MTEHKAEKILEDGPPRPLAAPGAPEAVEANGVRAGHGSRQPEAVPHGENEGRDDFYF